MHVFTGEVRNYRDRFFFAQSHTQEAMLAVFHVFEDRFLSVRIPAYDIYKTGFVAYLAADAFIRVELYSMFRIDQDRLPPFLLVIILNLYI